MCCPIGWIAHLVSAIGAINWGLVALFHFDLVYFICRFIPIPKLNIVIYLFIAACGAYSLFMLIMKKACKG